MREPCYKCKFEHNPIDREPCEYCSDEYMNSGDHPAFQWAKSPSNADRIRAMTDEELAAAICKIEQMTAKQGHRGFHAWLDWLKEEADHD